MLLLKTSMDRKNNPRVGVIAFIRNAFRVSYEKRHLRFDLTSPESQSEEE
jgi:hypothetical protein